MTVFRFHCCTLHWFQGRRNPLEAGGCGNEDSSACEGCSDAQTEHKTEMIKYTWLMVTPAM